MTIKDFYDGKTTVPERDPKKSRQNMEELLVGQVVVGVGPDKEGRMAIEFQDKFLIFSGRYMVGDAEDITERPPRQ